MIKPKRHWVQFSLRACLLLVTLISVALSMWVVPAERQRRAVAAVSALGGNISYGNEVASKTFLGKWRQAYLRKVKVVEMRHCWTMNRAFGAPSAVAIEPVSPSPLAVGGGTFAFAIPTGYHGGRDEELKTTADNLSSSGHPSFARPSFFPIHTIAHTAQQIIPLASDTHQITGRLNRVPPAIINSVSLESIIMDDMPAIQA